MKKRLISLLLVAMVSILMPGPIVWADALYPQKQMETAIQKSLSYFHTIQNKDGGFPTQAGQNSSLTATSWVIMALAAIGEDVNSNAWEPNGKSPLDFLQNSTYPLQATNDYARTLLALSAAGSPPVYQQVNLADKIISFQQPSGQFAQLDQGETGYINAHMWSILALKSAGYDIPNQEKAKQWLISRQNPDGGFGWIEGIASDADDTSIAVQTLTVLGESPATSPSLQKALKYLQSCQLKEGGFSSGNDWMGSQANTASTAWVLQALLAAGENATSAAWTIEGKNPIAYLLNQQNRDGSFNFTADTSASPVTMTAYSVMALAQKALPVNISRLAANDLEMVAKSIGDNVSSPLQ